LAQDIVPKRSCKTASGSRHHGCISGNALNWCPKRLQNGQEGRLEKKMEKK
jgi:hypothetical protein